MKSPVGEISHSERPTGRHGCPAYDYGAMKASPISQAGIHPRPTWDRPGSTRAPDAAGCLRARLYSGGVRVNSSAIRVPEGGFFDPVESVLPLAWCLGTTTVSVQTCSLVRPLSIPGSSLVPATEMAPIAQVVYPKPLTVCRRSLHTIMPKARTAKIPVLQGLSLTPPPLPRIQTASIGHARRKPLHFRQVFQRWFANELFVFHLKGFVLQHVTTTNTPS